MSTSTKKRRVATGNNGGGVDNNGVDDGITMSTILTKLNDMQNEMNGMKSRLSHMDELEKKYQRQENECSLLKANCNVLEKKCTNLDIRCDSLQRSVQIFSKESKWKYSAPPIPLSHWRGFDEEYTEEMTSMLSDIKDYSCDLRNGEQVDSIRLGQESRADVEIDMLHHDDVLLPHWEEFANALQLHNVNHYILQIANVQLTSEILVLLAPAWKGKPFMEFIFDRNGLVNNEGTKFSTECIKHNNELQKFHYMSNEIDNMEDAMLLVDAIVSHPSINSVHVENCLGGDINSYEVLRPLFASDRNRTWDQLDLERNNIQTRDSTDLPDYTASNPPLRYLFLAGNELNDNDAILMASALKGNTNLESLRIGGNNITDIGRNALTKVVYDPTSLNSMSDCNHICKIHLDGGIYLDGGMENIPIGCSNCEENLTSPNSRRLSKIYHLLSERNKEGSNVNHLNLEFKDEDDKDDSLKLVPKVLAAIQHYHDKYLPYNGPQLHHSLSIMFEVLRGWKIPELYEKQS